MKSFKRLILPIVAVIALSMPSDTKADIALGLNFNLPSWGAGLHARVDKVFITTNYLFDGGTFGLSVDWIVLNPKLSDSFALYVAPGLFAGFGTPFSFGLEIPSGVVWTPNKLLEIYGQIVPNFLLTPSTSFDVGGSVGFRFVL